MSLIPEPTEEEIEDSRDFANIPLFYFYDEVTIRSSQKRGVVDEIKKEIYNHGTRFSYKIIISNKEYDNQEWVYESDLYRYYPIDCRIKGPALDVMLLANSKGRSVVFCSNCGYLGDLDPFSDKIRVCPKCNSGLKPKGIDSRTWREMPRSERRLLKEKKGYPISKALMGTNIDLTGSKKTSISKNDGKKYCPICHKDLPGDSAFCLYCGKKL